MPPQEGHFQPERLTLARQRRGLTMTDLSMTADVSARSISAYERGTREPSDDSLQQLADALDHPRGYFFRPNAPMVDPDAVSFRSLARMTAKNRDETLATVSSAIELDAWIDARFDRPAADMPDLRQLAPDAAAEALRAEWDLGSRPIRNMIHLLEARGVRVYSLAHHSGDMDAVSLWVGDTPFVFLNTTSTAERSRFDAAHELAHLVLHRHGAPTGQAAESEANSFAGSFLMPRDDVLANAPRKPETAAIIAAKARWGVSALALVYRMHELELLSDWHYRQLCIRLRKHFGKSEPREMPRESSQILNKVFAVVRNSGGNVGGIARDLALPRDDVSEIVFSLTTMMAVDGGGQSSEGNAGRPDLRVL